MHAITGLARAEQSDVVASAYGGEALGFGPEDLIPRPFDPRLMLRIAPAVAQAAAASGVASRPVVDFDAYRDKLQTLVYASGTTMKPIFAIAKRAARKNVAFAEGEDRRVLRAAQVVVDEGVARPWLVGRTSQIERRIEQLGLRLKVGRDVKIVNIDNDHRYRDYWQTQVDQTRKFLTIGSGEQHPVDLRGEHHLRLQPRCANLRRTDSGAGARHPT